MKIDVICCGESSKDYVNTGNVTVGVNDCYRIYPVDYLVCVDLPKAFSKERLRQILNSRPIKFYSFLNEWKPLMKTYEKITLANGSGNLKQLNTDKVCYSNNSAFVAVVMAYKLGAKEINLYGADFNTHPNFKDANNLKKTLKEFKELNKLLSLNGCKLMVTKESRLSDFIPCI